MVSDLVVLDPALTPAQYSKLADVPPEHEWLANLPNEKTKRAYKADVEDFSRFAGLKSPKELRTVARALVIAWRKSLEKKELRPRKISGTFSEKGGSDYLRLLAIAQTCRFQRKSFLGFLLSESTDVDEYRDRSRMHPDWATDR